MNLVVLSEAAKVIMGQSPPSSTYNTKGEGLPFFQGKADFGDLYPAARVFCTEPQRVAEPGDILISVRAPVGPTNLSPHRSCIGRGLAAIRPIANTDTKYLLYFLRFHEPELAKAGTGSTFEAVSRDDIEDIKVPLPPLPEQQRIAGILARADRLRGLRRYALELSEGYLQAVFVEMFGDYGRFPSCELEELLREDPKNGLYLPAEQYGHGSPIIRITDFYDGILSGPDQFKRVYANETQVKEFCVSEGDILVNRVNSLEYLGKCALVHGLRETTLFESNMMRVRMDTSRITPAFMVRFLSLPYGYQQILQKARKAVNQASINQQDLKSLRIFVPPLAAQRAYEAIRHQYDRLRAQQREAARQAEQLFGALLDRAFRGEL